MRIPTIIRAILIALVLAALNTGCASGPDPVTRAYIEDANEAIDNDRLEEAKIMAELAVERNPNLRDSRALLAQIHRSLAAEALDEERPRDALKHLEQAGLHEPSRLVRARDYMAAVEFAIDLHVNSDEIGRLASLAVEADPSHIEARRQAALHLDNANAHTEALVHYLWLWSAFPEEVPLGLRLGMLYMSEGLYSDANAVFESILARDSQNVQAALNRATALEEMGRIGDARQTYDDIIGQFPDNPSLLLRYAGFLERIGETRRAELLKDKAYDHMPGVERRELRRLR